MSLYESGDERAAGDDSQSLAARVVESRFRESVADSLSLRLRRHLRMSEDDRPVPATILAYAQLTIDIDFETTRVFVVSD